MQTVDLMTLANPWVKLKTENFTATDFATLKSTLTRPSGDGVVDLLTEAVSPGAKIPNGIVFRPFGTDANDEVFNLRVYGWSQEIKTKSWENILLAELAITLGNIQGTADCAITDNDFEADTIAITYGNSNVSVEAVSPVNNVRGASVRMDIFGSQILQFDFDMDTAASGNLIYRMI